MDNIHSLQEHLPKTHLDQSIKQRDQRNKYINDKLINISKSSSIPIPSTTPTPNNSPDTQYYS